jgi:hypothetical protein
LGHPTVQMLVKKLHRGSIGESFISMVGQTI